MLYTIQLHANSGNWATPDGRQSLKIAQNKQEVNDLFQDWADTVGRYEDERCAYAFVWKGELDDVTDQYPDCELTFGPRMGINWIPC
jgi:hypothetical protein